MCGIVGYSWADRCSLTVSQKRDLLKLAAMGADNRGGQSYGWVILDKDKPVIHKAMGPLVGANFTTLAQAPMGYLHSRFATKGAINVENSHPFTYGTIVGSHNGCIYNSNELDAMYGNRAVDSEHIFNQISKGQNLDEFCGYGIIQYIDTRSPDRIFLANIGSGECSLFEIYDAEDKFFQGFFWCSTKETGELALAGAGIHNYEVFSLAEGSVYVFVHGEDDTYVVKDLELKVQSQKHSGISFGSSHKIDWDDDSYKQWGMSAWDGKEDEPEENPSLKERFIGAEDTFWAEYKAAKGLDFESEEDENEFKSEMSDYLADDYKEIQNTIKKTG